MKKIFIWSIAFSFLFSFIYTNQALAKDLSIKDLINLLILIDVIPHDKIPAVNDFLANLDKTDSTHDSIRPDRPIPHKPVPDIEIVIPDELEKAKIPDVNVVFENKLRGPAEYQAAADDCKNSGLRLPTWDELISSKANPEQMLVDYGPTNEGRMWSGQYCGYRDYAAHSTAWRGIPDYASDGRDPRAVSYWNNCTEDNGEHFYQCVVESDQTVEKSLSLKSEAVATSTFNYLVTAVPGISRLSLTLSCDKTKVSVSAKGGWTCGDILNFDFGTTQNFTFPNVTYTLINSAENQTIGVSAVGYLDDEKIGSDKDAITIN